MAASANGKKVKIDAFNKALTLLNQRWYTRRQLGDKLRLSGYGTAECEHALDECARLGFINDQRLAGDYAQYRTECGCGVRRIALDMRKKGFAPELAAATLADFADGENDRAIRLLEQRIPALLREPDQRKRRAKAFRYLAGRGFLSDAIYAAMAACRSRLLDMDEAE